MWLQPRNDTHLEQKLPLHSVEMRNLEGAVSFCFQNTLQDGLETHSNMAENFGRVLPPGRLDGCDEPVN